MRELLIGKVWLQRFYDILHRISLRGMNYGMAAYVESSGELFVIKNLRKILNKKNQELRVFDVGANDGYYLNCFLKEHKELIDIHAFEPSKFSFSLLNEKFKSRKSVTIQNFGFGSKSEIKTLFFDQEGSGWSSVHPIKHDHLSVSLDCQEKITLKTIDEYCSEHSIAEIDFLKMDVEGHELEILKGAKKMIESGKINCVQFEFGIAHLISRVFLRDFFEILEGYDIYRILQDGIFKINYSERFEVFMNSNYLAVRK